jgi:hypothetical protein
MPLSQILNDVGKVRGGQPMGRTAGIIFSAVMIYIVGLITFLFGGVTMSMAISDASGAGSARGYFGPFAIPAAIVLIGLGGWGIASGVGIGKMREWARISMLAFGAILFVIAVFGMLEMILDPHAGVTYLEGVYAGSIRVEMMAFFAWLAALGGFWLYFFSRNSVKVQSSNRW